MQMNIESRSTAITLPIREHIHQRLIAALDQHADRVRRVSVRLSDLNGPRGGIDQLCRVSVQLKDGTTLHHERKGMDLYANVSLIADKVKRRVGRRIAKIKEIRR